MPNRRVRGRGRVGAGTVVKVPFSVLITSAATPSFQTPLQPGQFSRLVTVQDAYEFFRFTRIRYRLYPVGTGFTQGVAFLADPDNTTPPTTLVQIIDTGLGVIMTGNETEVSRWMSVPKKLLRGAFQWYGANTPAGTDPPGNQGQFCFFNSAANTLQCEVNGECEFSVQAAVLNTPEIELAEAALRRARLAARAAIERERVLQYLQVNSSSPPPPVAQIRGVTLGGL